MRCFGIVVVVSVLLAVSAGAQTTYYVNGACGNDSWSGLDPNCIAPDGPKATIQAAIGAAVDGDEIVVHSATYHEKVDFGTKQIVLRSTNPADPAVVASTIIDGDLDGNPNTREGPTVTITGGQGPETVLSGFAIIGGSGKEENWLYWGGGVFCDASSPKLIHLQVHDNHPTFGGGIFCRDGAPLIAYSIISDNTATHAGGGIQCVRCPEALILSNLIAGNTADTSTGGGIDLYDCGAGPRIVNNTIVDNASPAQEGGGVCFELSSPQIYNNIVAFNSNWGIAGRAGATGTIDYNDVWGNAGGDYWGGAALGPSDISADPLFVDRPGGDFHLQLISPCFNAGRSAAAVVFEDTTTAWGSTTTIAVADARQYAVDDEIEYDGDRIARTVTVVDSSANEITFDQSLSFHSQPEVALSNYGWGDLDGFDRMGFWTVDIGAYELQEVSVLDRVHNLTVDRWYSYIQDAIDDAGDGDEILVVPSVYVENIHFDGKQIIVRSIDPSDPNVVGATIIDGGANGSVVTFVGAEGPQTVLNGFTITNGHNDHGGGIHGGAVGAHTRATIANSIITNSKAQYLGPHGMGGGLFRCDGDIINCTIRSNHAASNGGGLNQCHGTIQDCRIERNSTWEDAGGGVVACHGLIANCTISDNWGDLEGGGLAYCQAETVNCLVTGNCGSWRGGGLLGCSGPVTGCIVVENRAGGYGGGIADCEGPILNCLIVGNSASRLSGYGGGLGFCGGPIMNCVILRNDAWSGGGLFSCGGPVVNCVVVANAASENCGGIGESYVINCIIWGNFAPQDPQVSSSVVSHHSCIQDWGGGLGNIIADPMFADPDGPDDDPNTWADNDYHLLADSPCINRGDPNFAADPNDVDMDGDPRVVHGRVDMGADEYTGALPPVRPALVATEASPNGTLPKTQNNVMQLLFDLPIVLPAGDALGIVELADPNNDLSSLFTYQIDPADPNGLTLKPTENGAQLADQTWYRVMPAAGFDVHRFEIDMCALRGDADGSGRVTTADYSEVKAHLGERNTDARYDLNGSGRVTTADYSVVKAHLGNRAPAKP